MLDSLLALVKLIAGVATGSVAVLAEAAHSMADLVVSVATSYSLRAARKPADEGHPFGHGQVETLAATAGAVAGFAAAAVVLYLSVQRLAGSADVRFLEAGIGALLLSAIANGIARKRIRVAARTYGSATVLGRTRHLFGDVYVSLAVAGGLMVTRLTGITVLDPALAVAVALYMSWTAWTLSRRSAGGLVDENLPPPERAAIESCIRQHGRDLVGFHDLRTRRAGHQRYIDVHLVVQRDASLQEAHRTCDHLEGDIARLLPRASIMIHCEPCHPEECEQCAVICREHQENRTGRD